MARIIHDGQGGSHSTTGQLTVLQADGQTKLALPEGDFMTQGDILRDGQDLVLQSSDGHQVIVEGYFSALPAPTLTTPGGSMLTPELVQSFARSETLQYAAHETGNDASAIGIIKELSGEATITRADGSPEKAALGAEIHQGDIIETSAQGAVNIVFLDESTFAVSSNARMAIDEYVYDPATQSGETNVSILRGMFVFTSGLIGRDDPDDVHIETPVGSIGIRGTTIAGHILPDGQSQITVVEGAIVIRNGSGEVTLADQYQTVNIAGFDAPIQLAGTLDASQMKSAYGMIGTVAPAFMNTLNIGPESREDIPADEAAPADAPADTPADAAAPGAEQGQAEATQPVVASYDIFSDSLHTGFEQSITPASANPFDMTAVAGASLPGASGLSFMTTHTVPLSGARNGTAAMATASIEPAAPLPPLEVVIEIFVDDNALMGDVVGKVFTTIAYPHVEVRFADVPLDNGLPVFELVRVAPGVYNVVLTAAGDHALSLISGANTSTLGAVEVMAMLPDGRTATAAGSSYYGDFNNSTPVTPTPVPPLDLGSMANNDGYSYTLTPGATDGVGYNAAYLGDYNRDGSPDFAYSYGGTHYIQIGLTAIGSVTNQLTIAGNGDVNGDGYLDFVAGAAYYNTNQGQVSIYNGASIPVAATKTGSTGALMGSSVAMIDFNGDGYADVFAGSKGANGSEGSVGFYAGNSAMSFTGVTFATFVQGATGGYTDMLGVSMTGLRDFNNDGFGDLAVGRMTSAYSGEVVIYKGGDDFTQNIAAVITVGAVDNFNIPLYDLGDINGDGRSDLLIGETGYNANSDGIMEGRALIAFGGGSGVSLSITVGDGVQMVGAGSAGDFNGDGYNDIFIATRTANIVDAYVIYGGGNLPGSLSLDPTWLTSNPGSYFHMTLDLNAYGLPTDFDMSSISIGDQNGDGFQDLLITSDELNDNGGAYFVVYGRADPQSGIGHGGVGPTGSDTMTNQGNSHDSFRAGNGDDLIRLFGTGNSLARVIDGGNGMDSLALASNGNIDLRNISQLSSIEEFSFEATGTQSLTIGLDDIFTLLQTSNQKMNAGEGNLFTVIFGNADGSPGKALVIDAASSTATDLGSAGFSAQGTYTDGGGNQYNIYTFGSGYQLLIDTDITVTVQ